MAATYHLNNEDIVLNHKDIKELLELPLELPYVVLDECNDKELRINGEYYDAYDLMKLIESLHKDCHGNFKISFDNNFGYDESLVKSPITKDGKPIGVITSVTSEKVEGFIWERYMPIVAELDHN